MESPSQAPVAEASQAGQSPGVTVTRIDYHGWPESYLVANGIVEAVIVPAVGRVMQLRLAGGREGTFWENRALDGQLHNAVSDQWMNFGGDKCWPAPQSAWGEQQDRDWPPPMAFDSRPMETAAGEFGLVLRSAVDEDYGVKVVRHVELEPDRPVMRIRTEFRKIHGDAVRVGVWTITQMREPERISILLPAMSKFADGYIRLMESAPAQLKIDGRLLSFVRHPSAHVKIGTEASNLVWVGTNSLVRIEVERRPGEYPAGGCVTEVYTNPGALSYVELETLGPLTTLRPGDWIELTTVYTVLPRSTGDPEEEAQNVFRSVELRAKPE